MLPSTLRAFTLRKEVDVWYGGACHTLFWKLKTQEGNKTHNLLIAITRHWIQSVLNAHGICWAIRWYHFTPKTWNLRFLKLHLLKTKVVHKTEVAQGLLYDYLFFKVLPVYHLDFYQKSKALWKKWKLPED